MKGNRDHDRPHGNTDHLRRYGWEVNLTNFFRPPIPSYNESSAEFDGDRIQLRLTLEA